MIELQVVLLHHKDASSQHNRPKEDSLAPARGQADFGSLCSHPWTYANLIWMHNGCIADFHKIKRRLQNDLSDEMFSVPQGNTDSEWSFALFLDQLAQVTSHLHSSES